MPHTQFKLLKRDDVTRRAAFPDQPTWHALATRIGSLYAIPIDKVGVSYVDTDGDEITLSSQEELQDFYRFHHSGNIIKFGVQDFSVSRDESKALPATPTSTNVRNTFGQDPFDIDDGWQRLPTFGGLDDIYMASGSHSPHGFVETVPSDASSVAKGHGELDEDDDRHSTITSPSIVRTATLDKGKSRAMSISSAGSVLAENSPAKHPVHVYDISYHDNAGPFGLPTSSTAHSVHEMPIIAESTPKLAVQELAPPEVSPMATETPASTADVQDPPLPSLDSPTPVAATPSLANDLATFLTTLTNVISSHPELSEGVHNLIHKAANGTYWSAERDAMSKAAAEIAEHTGKAADQLRRTAESEASRRVTDAIEGIFKSLAVGPGLRGTRHDDNPTNVAADSGPTAPSAEQSSQTWGADGQATDNNSTSFWYGASAIGTRGRGLRGSLPQGSMGMRGRSHGNSRFGSWGPSWAYGHPPPSQSGYHHHPPGPPFQGPQPPPPPPSFGHHHAGPFHHLPIPPPGIHPSHQGKAHTPTPPPPPRPNGAPSSLHPPGHWDSAIPPWDMFAVAPLAPQEGDRTGTKASPQELRAQVDAAKQLYKAEKERYRQEREERRKERERRVRIASET